MTVCRILSICLLYGLHSVVYANGENTTTVSLNYTMDQQVAGFNGTNITSGPIILVDLRTLYVTDLRYSGWQKVVDFWVGEGINPQSDTKKQLVLSELLSNSSKNLYVTLPENTDLTSINFFQVMSKNQSLAHVMLDKINRSAIRTYSPSNMADSIFRIPKCCKPDEYLNETLRDCSPAKRFVSINLKVFESNETGLDPDVSLNSSEYQLVPFYGDVKCEENKAKVQVDELHGLIYNSSLIVQGTGILSYEDYCIDVLAFEDGSSETMALYCVVQLPVFSDPNFYLPVLIMSTIGFALSAGAYGYILGANDIHKRCLVIFSSSMCLAFTCLIVMQVQNHKATCSAFGFIFLFMVVLSFIWLLILCLELLYQVRQPIEKERWDKRWYYYCGISLGLTVLTFAISIFSGALWIPDVPNSFIMNYGQSKCEFQTSFARAFITFVPIIISILGSFVCLAVLQCCINKNEQNKHIHNHYDWLRHLNSYKFLSRTYIIIIIVACFWLLNIVFYTHTLESAKTQLALDVIKASLGCVTFIGLVTNKYTREEIFNKCRRKRDLTEKELELSGVPSVPATPEAAPLVNPVNNLVTFNSHNTQRNT